MNPRQLQQMAQKMQKEMAKVQEELGQTMVEGSAGGGAVKAVVNGHRELQSLTINPEVVDPDDVEILQDLLVAAVNDASKRAAELAEQRMGAVTGGLGGLGGLF
jgi:nucleoid-associated protein EbfC